MKFLSDKLKERKSYLIVFSLIGLLFSCFKKEEINEEIIKIYLNHSYYNLSYSEIKKVVGDNIFNLKKIDKNFNLVNLKKGRKLTLYDDKLKVEKKFYPFIIKKINGEYRIVYLFRNDKINFQEIIGSKINKINNIDIQDKTEKEIENILKTKDVIEMILEKNKKTDSVKFEKDVIFFPFVWGFNLSDDVKYIRIHAFFEHSDVDFENLLNDGKSLRNLVIDLRDLKMGNLEEMSKIASYFVGKDKVLFYEKSSKNIYNKTFISDNGNFSKTNIMVIVNKNTAFLGEILAASLKENNNAIIIGEKTAGNFYLTKAFNLSDKRFCILSVAKLYPPSNKEMDFVEPDHYYEDNEEKDIDKLNYIIDTDPLFNEILNKYIFSS